MPLNKPIIALSGLAGTILLGLLIYSGNATRIIKLVSQNVDFFDIYQNIANPYIRYVRIPAGLRKEEVADIYSKSLAWNDQDMKEFLNSDVNQVNLKGCFPIARLEEAVSEKIIGIFLVPCEKLLCIFFFF